MKTLAQYIQETFDTTPVKWKKIKSNRYTFRIDAIKYFVAFLHEDAPTVEIEFGIDEGPYSDNKFNITGTGNQFKVLVTVIDVIKDYVNRNLDRFKEGQAILFFSSEEKSRTKVYKRLIKRSLPSYFDIEIDESGKTTDFYIGTPDGLEDYY